MMGLVWQELYTMRKTIRLYIGIPNDRMDNG